MDVASASPAWARGTINARLKAILATMAITPILTGVLVSSREKKPGASTLISMKASKPAE